MRRILLSIIFSIIILYFAIFLFNSISFPLTTLVLLVAAFVLLFYGLFRLLKLEFDTFFEFLVGISKEKKGVKLVSIMFISFTTAAVFLLVVFFGFIFFILDSSGQGQLIQVMPLEKPVTDFPNYIYFSGVTFFNLGYGDMIPKGLLKIIALIESFVGLLVATFFIGLGVALISKIVREVYPLYKKDKQVLNKEESKQKASTEKKRDWLTIGTWVLAFAAIGGLVFNSYTLDQYKRQLDLAEARWGSEKPNFDKPLNLACQSIRGAISLGELTLDLDRFKVMNYGILPGSFKTDIKLSREDINCSILIDAPSGQRWATLDGKWYKGAGGCEMSSSPLFSGEIANVTDNFYLSLESLSKEDEFRFTQSFYYPDNNRFSTISCNCKQVFGELQEGSKVTFSCEQA